MTDTDIDLLVKKADKRNDILNTAYDVVRDALVKNNDAKSYPEVSYLVTQSRKRIIKAEKNKRG
jgi:hypothetical protein